MTYPWLAQERRFIRRAIDDGRLVLGVCLGSQFVADALGARVFRNPCRPRDRLVHDPAHRRGGRLRHLRGRARPAMVFHWHGDTFDLPGRRPSVWPRSDATPIQAFEARGGRVLGLQFHPEVTPEAVAGARRGGRERAGAGPAVRAVARGAAVRGGASRGRSWACCWPTSWAGWSAAPASRDPARRGAGFGHNRAHARPAPCSSRAASPWASPSPRPSAPSACSASGARLRGGRALGLATGLGAATADGVYGAIAAFGVTAVSAVLVGARGWLGLAGGVFLVYLGVRTIAAEPARERDERGEPKSLVAAWSSTFLLTLGNPSTILMFVAVFAALGVAAQGTGVRGTARARGGRLLRKRRLVAHPLDVGGVRPASALGQHDGVDRPGLRRGDRRASASWPRLAASSCSACSAAARCERRAPAIRRRPATRARAGARASRCR